LHANAPIAYKLAQTFEGYKKTGVIVAYGG